MKLGVARRFCSLHGCVSGADSQPTGPRDFERLSSLLMKPTHPAWGVSLPLYPPAV